MTVIVVLLCIDLASSRVSVPAWGYIALSLTVIVVWLLRLAVSRAAQ